MPLTALALALGAALLHASWNTLLARAGDTDAFTAVALAVGWCAVLPVALLGWRLEPAAVPYVIGGGLLQVAYFGLLAAAYRAADMSLVYPLARGLAPVLVLFLAVLAVGAVPTLAEVVAVFLVALGVLLVRGLRDPGRGPGALLAVAVACTIAGYTVIDQQGLKHAAPFTYLFVEQSLPAAAYVAVSLWRRGPQPLRAVWGWPVVVSGVLMNLTYGLVLIALTLASAAAVSAVRESGVVIATAMAYLFLHERVGRGRAAGSVLVVAGIGLLALA